MTATEGMLIQLKQLFRISICDYLINARPLPSPRGLKCWNLGLVGLEAQGITRVAAAIGPKESDLGGGVQMMAIGQYNRMEKKKKTVNMTVNCACWNGNEWTEVACMPNV